MGELLKVYISGRERERLGRWGNDYQNTHLESKYTHREMKELKKNANYSNMKRTVQYKK